VQHRYARAAEEFRRAAELAPGQALAEDAWYWHGIALARGGMKRQAIAVLRRFVLDYASSARHSEVAAMLGWLLLDGAEYKEAERMFQLARQSSRTEVRSSGESGLEALKSRRAAPHAQTRQGAVR
jgi:TolA-binding protein